MWIGYTVGRPHTSLGVSRFAGTLTDMIQHPELAKIAERIRQRDAHQAADRERQRTIMRELIAEGHTWDEVQAAARVSRQTLRNALRTTS